VKVARSDPNTKRRIPEVRGGSSRAAMPWLQCHLPTCVPGLLTGGGMMIEAYATGYPVRITPHASRDPVGFTRPWAAPLRAAIPLARTAKQ
jgi:hypothetical protein